MEIFGIGTDIIEISRIKKNIENQKFIKRIFTDREIEYFEKRGMKRESIAATFSAKEAVSKAVGTGIRGFNFNDIEILRDKNGKPYVVANGKFKKFCTDNKICEIKVSLSHCREYAVANAMAITRSENYDE